MRRIEVGILLTVVVAVAVPPWAAADTLHVEADAQTSSVNAAVRYGSAPAMAVRQLANGPDLMSYARFDLDALPPDPDVQKATLRLWVSGVSIPGTVEILPVLESWQELAISGEASPALGAPLATLTIATGDASHFLTLDVTELVQDWASDALDNNGIALRGLPTGVLHVVFDTKESKDTSHPVELEVALASPGVPGSPGPAGPQGDPGPQGPQGDPGIQGPEGPVGPQGVTGSEGPQGQQGAQGEQGIQGLPGQQGPQGEQGPQGQQGPQGSAGPPGEQGETGPMGPQGPAGAVRYDPELVAQLRWDLLPTYAETTVGQQPVALAFDGSNIWVANQDSDTVTKLRVRDGKPLGVFAVGNGPSALAFDGSAIWVANELADTLMKLDVDTGSVLVTLPAGGESPVALAFDGTYIWVANRDSDNVHKVSTKGPVGTFNVGNGPRALAFDGNNIWVANQDSDSVSKLRASDGQGLGTFPIQRPFALAFDGVGLWVLGQSPFAFLTKLSLDGSVIGQPDFEATGTSKALAFDGTHILAAFDLDALLNGTVAKFRARDGFLDGFLGVGRAPKAIAFDGFNIWVASSDNGTVSKY